MSYYPYNPYVIVSEKHAPRLAQQCTRCEFLQDDHLVDCNWRCYRPLGTDCDYHYKKEDSDNYDGPGYYI